MTKFFVGPEGISGSKIYIDDSGDLKHLSRVLRKRVGDIIEVSDGQLWEYEGEIIEITPTCATLRILDKQKFSKEPSTRVSLYQGVPKGSKMETIIQKTVEVGIDRIIPVFMERTIVTETSNFPKKLIRWQKIADEAVKQCKRGIIPKVETNCSFDKMLEELKASDYDIIICPYENEENRTIKDALKGKQGDRGKKIALIIGPEGGFSEEEISKLTSLDIEVVSLGKTTLRTETAGLVGLAMVMYELEL